jgi:hypothetical protein
LQACSNQAKKQPSAPEIYKLEAKWYKLMVWKASKGFDNSPIVSYSLLPMSQSKTTNSVNKTKMIKMKTYNSKTMKTK